MECRCEQNGYRMISELIGRGQPLHYQMTAVSSSCSVFCVSKRHRWLWIALHERMNRLAHFTDCCLHFDRTYFLGCVPLGHLLAVAMIKGCLPPWACTAPIQFYRRLWFRHAQTRRTMKETPWSILNCLLKNRSCRIAMFFYVNLQNKDGRHASVACSPADQHAWIVSSNWMAMNESRSELWSKILMHSLAMSTRASASTRTSIS